MCHFPQEVLSKSGVSVRKRRQLSCFWHLRPTRATPLSSTSLRMHVYSECRAQGQSPGQNSLPPDYGIVPVFLGILGPSWGVRTVTVFLKVLGNSGESMGEPVKMQDPNMGRGDCIDLPLYVCPICHHGSGTGMVTQVKSPLHW